MMEHTETVPPSPPVKLAALALEMDTTVDAVERQIGASNIFMFGGFRCCTGFFASEVLAAHHRRKAEAARRQADDQERTRRYCEAQHAAIPKGFTEFKLEHRTIDVNPVPAVARMTAQAPADYDGGTYTKRPSRLDWMTGKAEGGEQIGPSAEQIRRRAEKKGGSK